MRVLAALLALMAIAVAPARASADGTLFVFAVPQPYPGHVLSVEVAGRAPASVTVEVPGLSFSQTVALSATLVASVTLPANAHAGASGTTTARAVRVTSTAPVSVVAQSYQTGSSSSFVVEPVVTLGTSYRALALPSNDAVSAPSQLVIVGTEAGTNVEIVPPANDSLPANQATNIALGALEVYALTASASGGDLTGTSVVADKPVAVISGSQLAYVQAFGGDAALEMMPSLDKLGTVVPVVTAPDRPQGTNFLRILAPAAVDLSYDPPVSGAPASLTGGTFAQFPYTNDTVITATGPILVGQVTAGGDLLPSPFQLGDPSLVIAQPVSAWPVNPLVLVPLPILSYTRLKIVARCSDASSPFGVRVEGAPLPAASFSPIGASPYCTATFAPSTLFSRTLEADHAVTAYLYGHASYEARVHGVELGSGDTPDPDEDGDGQPDEEDNCPAVANPGQQDGDADAVGDVCDNCPATSNTSQSDANDDGTGDRCQNGDFNGDGVNDILDIVLQRRRLVDLEPTLDPAMPPQDP